MTPRLILASGSPRRSHLLAEAGFAFEVDPPGTEEAVLPAERPDAMVVRLAREKAEEVMARYAGDCCVLACDTAVVLGGEVLGKPDDAADAVATLIRLGGRTHTVVSGFVIVVPAAAPVVQTVSTAVEMTPISRADAVEYVRTGEPLDKAGSYAIQGRGRRFVAGWVGSFTNVMGLPMEAVVPALGSVGVVPAQNVP